MENMQSIQKHRLVTPGYRGGLSGPHAPREVRFTVTRELAVRIEELRELVAENDFDHITVDHDGPVAFGEGLDDLDESGIEYGALKLCVSSLTFWFQADAKDNLPGELTSEQRFVQELTRHFALDAIDVEPTASPAVEQGDPVSAVPRAVVFMEGGLIHHVKADLPLQVLILDADTEGGDPENIRVIEGNDAFTSLWRIDSRDGLDAERVDAIFREFGADAEDSSEEEALPPGMMRVKVVVVATNGDGAPDVHSCEVAVSREQYDNGEHYERGKDDASNNGYDYPMLAFDANDQAAKAIASGQLGAWLRGN